MSTFEVLTILLTALTLLGTFTLTVLNLMVTITGWTVTGHHQKELLKQQLESSERLTKLPLRSTRRADQFGKVTTWLSESEKIRRLALSLQYLPSAKDELIARFLEWETAYFSDILQTAEFLDKDLANLIRKYYGHMDLFIMYAINGQLNNLVSPLWTTEMNSAKDALTVKLNELDKAVVEK